jgi:cytochrome c553
LTGRCHAPRIARFFAPPEAPTRAAAAPIDDPSFQTMTKLNLFATVAGIAAAIAATSAAAQAAPAGDPAAGRQKTQMCSGCHGIEGWRTAYPEVYKVPKIVGQHPAYLVRALQAYKSGERSHQSMRAIAGSLSDKDMADLAAFYGQAVTKVAAK